MSYNSREARKVIYGLKRKLGRPIKAVIDKGVTHDHTDGTVTKDYDAQIIHKAIILVKRDFNTFIQDLAYISSNRNFTSGGLFEESDRLIIIDGQEKFNPQLASYFEFDSEKWKIAESDVLLDNRGYLVRVIKIKGNAPVGDSL